MKSLKGKTNNTKIIHINSLEDKTKAEILLIDKDDVDKLLNSLQEINTEIIKHLKSDEAPADET